MQGIAERVKDGASEAIGKVQQQAGSMVHEQKNRAADRLELVAEAIRDSGQNVEDQAELPGFSRLAEQAADQIENISQYVRSHEIADAIHEIEDFTRRHPVIVFGGALVAGLLVARVVRASRQRALDREFQSMDNWDDRDFGSDEFGYESSLGDEGRTFSPGLRGSERGAQSQSGLTGGLSPTGSTPTTRGPSGGDMSRSTSGGSPTGFQSPSSRAGESRSASGSSGSGSRSGGGRRPGRTENQGQSKNDEGRPQP